ncbi:class I SAM-dependent methyltransferase [Thermaurantimonas aggregans]|uniref:class I SAM-dependent methyltransferase n=1 Tax=Thermaurantimonas aggregans TaxID=2173829 RepID=UPI00135954DE|nr:class I SAM-dependent methyltransferase [Thermaurantimonas aggregans]MCX8149097.1 class I SAM-dependent methyltransferase [Thermaurantimonas aggregans]
MRKIYYSLRPEHRLLVRRLVYFPLDIFDRISGKRHPLQPPRGMIFTGRGDFIETGRHFVHLLKTHAELTSTSKVLDIGSGIGRLAVALTDVLSADGSYEGFDIVEIGIKWCQKNISSKYPNFTFTHLPARNHLYNLNTHTPSTSIRFPYQNDRFDIAVATSVFTHMLHDEVAHYLKEISRTLAPGGRAMLTFFCIDDHNRPYMNSAEIRFPHRHHKCYIMSEDVPEANVAYDLEEIQKLLHSAQLSLIHRIPGRWSGAPQFATSSEFQDTFFVRKILN